MDLAEAVFIRVTPHTYVLHRDVLAAKLPWLARWASPQWPGKRVMHGDALVLDPAAAFPVFDGGALDARDLAALFTWAYGGALPSGKGKPLRFWRAVADYLASDALARALRRQRWREMAGEGVKWLREHAPNRVPISVNTLCGYLLGIYMAVYMHSGRIALLLLLLCTLPVVWTHGAVLQPLVALADRAMAHEREMLKEVMTRDDYQVKFNAQTRFMGKTDEALASLVNMVYNYVAIPYLLTSVCMGLVGEVLEFLVPRSFLNVLLEQMVNTTRHL